MFRNTLFQQISQSIFCYIFDRNLPNAILIVQLNRGKPLGSNIVKQNMQIKNIQFLKKGTLSNTKRQTEKIPSCKAVPSLTRQLHVDSFFYPQTKEFTNSPAMLACGMHFRFGLDSFKVIMKLQVSCL